jgi:hypothetical protein
MAEQDIRVRPASMNRSANALVELAGFMHAGRPDSEMATEARSPRSHPEIGSEVVRFTRHALDQYVDAVALLGALSTKLRETADRYSTADNRAAEKFLKYGAVLNPDQ